eukprot:10365458-Heterocapsa_arctica.AAC.1
MLPARGRPEHARVTCPGQGRWPSRLATRPCPRRTRPYGAGPSRPLPRVAAYGRSSRNTAARSRPTGPHTPPSRSPR